jgi:hypothetical protein
LSETDRLIDAALAQYKLTPLPEGFVARTMAQVEVRQRQPLQAVDLAIAAAPAAVLASIVVLWWSTTRLDPLWVQEAQLDLKRLVLQVAHLDTVPLLLTVASIVVALFALPLMALAAERRPVAPN